MTDSSPPATEPAKKASRAGRDLPAAITSGVVLVVAILASLIFWKPAFMVIVAVAVVVAIWELNRGFRARGINLPEEPLMIGGATMVVLAYFLGAAWLVTATAVTGLVIMLWLLRRGVDGYVRDATASMFALFYVPFLGSFFALLAAEDRGAVGVLSVIALTICSDSDGFTRGSFWP
ncbi:MAG TPA: phosphatidate cytidylyltransferase, partial [Marmoricola sp.]|nr:phosphatidate cytidylyltransferase [Marmoricola sp.]